MTFDRQAARKMAEESLRIREQSPAKGPFYHDLDTRIGGCDQVTHHAPGGRYITLCFMATDGDDDRMHDDAAQITNALNSYHKLADMLIAASERVKELESQLACEGTKAGELND